MILKELIKESIKRSETFHKLDNYDLELVATNISNDIERQFKILSRN